ncbi:hypothetical protein PBY51_017987 [Eleginops maclovinus]|uniref:Uncharacterized protein n=1 Tax=Eleginops maclovinus TaxID=56733 RepID=A0AAN8APP9_ELEMC|nr:hypothetical protein PBY51_017987 [Eleginops maclovinus]
MDLLFYYGCNKAVGTAPSQATSYRQTQSFLSTKAGYLQLLSPSACVKRRRGNQQGSPERSSHEKWLLKSTRTPGNCDVSYATLGTQELVKNHPFSPPWPKGCSQHFKDFEVSLEHPPEASS